MQSVLIVIHLMVVVALVVAVLLQRSDGGALGIGGGGGFMTGRGQANALTRATGILAAVFFATSILLSILASIQNKPRSILDGPAGTQQSAPAAPGAPAPGGSVLDQLRQQEGGPPTPAPTPVPAPTQAPAAPAAPPAPQQ